MAQDFLEYGKDYKFTSKPLNPYLYELRVKDQYGNFEGVNLFFKLATHEPKSYENINLSFDNPNLLGNFNGLIIEPATTDTIIEIDLSSRFSVKNVKSSKALTILIKDHLKINEVDSFAILYDQEDKIFMKKLYASKVDNFIISNYNNVMDQSITLTMAHNSNISLNGGVKNFEALFFNETGEVRANIGFIGGFKRNYDFKKNKNTYKSIPIEKIHLANNRFFCVDKNVKEISLKIPGDNFVSITDCEIECDKIKSVISGDIGKLDLNKILLSVKGSLNIKADEVSLRHDKIQGSSNYRAHEFNIIGNNTIKAKVLRSISQSVRLENCNINMPDGELEFNDKKGEDRVELKGLVCNDSSARGLAMTNFYSKNSSFFVDKDMSNTPMPLISGNIQDTTMVDCVVGDNQLHKGIVELNIRDIDKLMKNAKKFGGIAFAPFSSTSIVIKSGYPVETLFENCLFKGQKNEIELNNTNIKAISSEFNDTYIETKGRPDKSDESKMGNLSLENSIFSGHNEICAIEDSKISSSTIKDTVLSGVSLVENSSMDKFKTMKDVYKDFNSDVKIEPAPKEVGVVNNEIEAL